MFFVASFLSLFSLFLSSFNLNIDLKERLDSKHVIDVCNTSACL